METVLSDRVREFIELNMPEAYALSEEDILNLVRDTRVKYHPFKDGGSLTLETDGYHDGHRWERGETIGIWLPLVINWELVIDGNDLIFKPTLVEINPRYRLTEDNTFLKFQLLSAFKQMKPELFPSPAHFPFQVKLVRIHKHLFVFATDEEDRYKDEIIAHGKVDNAEIKI